MDFLRFILGFLTIFGGGGDVPQLLTGSSSWVSFGSDEEGSEDAGENPDNEAMDVSDAGSEDGLEDEEDDEPLSLDCHGIPGRERAIDGRCVVCMESVDDIASMTLTWTQIGITVSYRSVGPAEFLVRGETDPGVWLECHDETWDQPGTEEICQVCHALRGSPPGCISLEGCGTWIRKPQLVIFTPAEVQALTDAGFF